MVWKGKLVVGLIGVCIASYGAYEAAIYVISSSNIQTKQEDNSLSTESKDDNTPKQINIPISDVQKDDIQEQKEHQPIPKVQTNPSVDKPTPTTNKSPLPPSTEDTNNDMFGSEENIDTIGRKFQNYLIGSKSDPAGVSKLNQGKHMKRGIYHDSFEIKSKTPTTLDALRTRCQNAYKRKKGSEVGKEAGKYRAAVGTFCSKPGVSEPDGGHED